MLTPGGTRNLRRHGFVGWRAAAGSSNVGFGSVAPGLELRRKGPISGPGAGGARDGRIGEVRLD